jgi:hypothetical protein
VHNCKKVVIPPNLASKTFDHKNVEITFQNARKKQGQKIKDTILRDPLLELTMKAYTFDCYNNHAVFSETYTPLSKSSISRKIGTILNEVKNIQKLKSEIVTGEAANLVLTAQRIELIETRINDLFRELPNLQYFENLQLEPEHDVFFETLAICLKNQALSFQSSFYKIKNMQKKSMAEQIQTLKQNYTQNADLIFDLESRLCTIIDLELKEELALIKKF